MPPPAPALFSITNGRPSSSAICAVTRRATRSTVPPAGNGSSRRIGLSGYCAAQGAAVATARATAAAAGQSRRPRNRNAEHMVTGPWRGGIVSALLTKIQFQRRLSKQLAPCDRVGDAVDQPVDGVLIAHLRLASDERAIARPDQPVGPGDADELARIVRRRRAEPVAGGDLDPGAAPLDRPQHGLEAVAVDAGARLGASK